MRRRQDSNLRYLAVHIVSNDAHSTALPLLRMYPLYDWRKYATHYSIKYFLFQLNKKGEDCIPRLCESTDIVGIMMY